MGCVLECGESDGGGGLADVIVIGGGVIGLSAAIRLGEAGFDVRVMAADPPESTTSAVAAAIWYPYKAYPEDRVLAWGKTTFGVLRGLSDDRATGVRMREGVELWRAEAPEPWWSGAVPGVRRCAPEELPPGYGSGHRFVVPVIEMPVYLPYLLDRFRAVGTVERRVVGSLGEVSDDAHAVVDCAGLGARDLVGDDTLRPIRGQVVRVRNPGLTEFFLDEDDPAGVTYVVPRSEDCILGGTAEEDDWDTEPDPAVAAGILRRCAALEPRLKGAEILEHRVGLRPGRPAVRLERDPDRASVVHNYGHGGSGVTLSWGCAEETLDVVRGVLAD